MLSKKPLNTFQNDVAAGSLNSLRQLTQTQYININSKYRNTAVLSSTTNFQISLPGNIAHVSEMELVNIEIPTYAYYMFSTDKVNNVFWVHGLKILIPDGNYTPQQLVTYLNATYFYQNTASTNVLSNIKFSFNSANLRCSFDIVDSSIQTGFLIQFYDIAMNIDVINTFGWQMGFMAPAYVISLVSDVVADTPVNLFAGRCLYLSINDFQYNNNNNNLVLLKNNSCLDDFLLGKIIIPGVTYENAYNVYAVNQLISFPRKYNGPVSLKKFEVKVYDEDGNLVLLNGLDFSFTLKLTIVYETL